MLLEVGQHTVRVMRLPESGGLTCKRPPSFAIAFLLQLQYFSAHCEFYTQLQSSLFATFMGPVSYPYNRPTDDVLIFSSKLITFSVVSLLVTVCAVRIRIRRGSKMQSIVFIIS